MTRDDGFACVGVALLAAGASRRLGTPKQLLPLSGVPLVRVIALELLRTRCRHHAIVLGARAGDVDAALGGLPLARILNLEWQRGIGGSLRCAARWARAFALDALVIVTCDQPRLDADHVNELVRAHAQGADLAASRYAGVLGVPALFASGHFDELEKLQGDQGARALLRSAAHVHAVDWPAGALDLDTPDDVERFRTGV